MWFAPACREQAITMFCRAAMGHPLPPAILEFDDDKLGGEYAVQAQYKPIKDSQDVLGVFSMFSRRVLTLTVRSRAVARLLGSHSIAEIAKELHMTPTAVVAAKKRISRKLDVSQHEVGLVCHLLRSIL